MTIALERLGFIGTYLGRVKADNMHELMMVHEAEHLLQSCMLSTLSTLQRKESGRSVYRRADYPEKSAAYDGRILVVNRKNGRPETFWR